MNFFNIGPGEFFLVLVMALVIFGPQRLPEVARRAGKAVRDLRDMVNNLDPELLQDWREITEDLDSVREEVRSMRSDMLDIQKDLTAAAKDVGDSVDDAVKDATKTVNEVIKDKPGAAKTPPKSPAPAAGPASAAKPATATSTTATTAAQPATSYASAQTKGLASAGAPPANSSAKPVTGSPTFRKSGVADSKDEVLGVPLTRNQDGDWEVLSEVVGQKVFPVWKKAPKAAAANGRHTASLTQVRPQARMARLAAPKPLERRPATTRPSLPNRSPRPLTGARSGRTARG